MTLLRLSDQSGGDLLRLQQAFLLHPFIGMEFSQIVFARVAYDEYDNRICIGITRDSQCGSEGGSGRAAAEDAFGSAELSRQIKGLRVSNVDDVVDVFDMNVRWNYFLSDSLDQIWRRLDQLSCLFVGLKN